MFCVMAFAYERVKWHHHRFAEWLMLGNYSSFILYADFKRCAMEKERERGRKRAIKTIDAVQKPKSHKTFLEIYTDIFLQCIVNSTRTMMMMMIIIINIQLQ